MKDLIETERLILRPWGEGDIQANYDGLKELDVAKFLTVPFPYTLENAKAFIKARIDNPNTKEKSYYAIVDKNSGEIIGGTSIEIKESIVAKGGIWINKKYHGKGYGTEAMRARIAYCFDELDVLYLDNGFLEGNDKSWHMQEKLGYRKTGEVFELNCPARGGMTKEIKTKLIKEGFVRK